MTLRAFIAITPASALGGHQRPLKGGISTHLRGGDISIPLAREK